MSFSFHFIFSCCLLLRPPTPQSLIILSFSLSPQTGLTSLIPLLLKLASYHSVAFVVSLYLVLHTPLPVTLTLTSNCSISFHPLNSGHYYESTLTPFFTSASYPSVSFHSLPFLVLPLARLSLSFITTCPHPAYLFHSLLSLTHSTLLPSHFPLPCPLQNP